MATLVRFIKDKEGVTAVFPQMKYNKHLYGNTMLCCYATIGQHSSCSIDWLENDTNPATPKQYASLKTELESIGYKLKIVEEKEKFKPFYTR